MLHIEISEEQAPEYLTQLDDIDGDYGPSFKRWLFNSCLDSLGMDVSIVSRRREVDNV